MMESDQKLNEIPILKEYSDVFPKDMPEFPLETKIEFSIELVLGRGPMYKLSPLELAKLKKQIEELLENGSFFLCC